MLQLDDAERIETHDETSFGAAGHEELYIVVSSGPAPSEAPPRPRPARRCW